MVLSLVQALSYPPVAIVQAASSINLARQSVKTYLELLEEPEPEIIQLPSEDRHGMRMPRMLVPPYGSYPLNTSIDTSARRGGPVVPGMLSCIGHSILAPTGRWLEGEVVKAVGVLKGYSFVTAQAASSDFTPLQDLYDMHPLLRDSGSTPAAGRRIVLFTEHHFVRCE